MEVHTMHQNNRWSGYSYADSIIGLVIILILSSSIFLLLLSLQKTMVEKQRAVIENESLLGIVRAISDIFENLETAYWRKQADFSLEKYLNASVVTAGESEIVFASDTIRIVLPDAVLQYPISIPYDIEELEYNGLSYPPGIQLTFQQKSGERTYQFISGSFPLGVQH